MKSKSRNLIILVSILAILLFIYFFFIKKPAEESNLVSSDGTNVSVPSAPSQTTPLADNFLAELLGIKNINLDDSIFSDPAFATLRDSTIILIQDGTEGRSNPFAPIGADPISTPTTILPIPTTTMPTTIPAVTTPPVIPVSPTPVN